VCQQVEPQFPQTLSADTQQKCTQSTGPACTTHMAMPLKAPHCQVCTIGDQFWQCLDVHAWNFDCLGSLCAKSLAAGPVVVVDNVVRLWSVIL
jgi:hypothetical protein